MVAILCAGRGLVASKGGCDDVTDDVVTDEATVDVTEVDEYHELDCKEKTILR